MFKKNIVVVVKNNNKILREHGDTVHIPFGSEYSLGFKNLENRKAVAKVEIDGVNVLGNHSLILAPGEEVNIERFITNNDFNQGNRFKFIKKTKEISDYRGDKIDDGLIRIEFKFEREQEIPTTLWSTQYSCYFSGDSSRGVCEPESVERICSASAAVGPIPNRESEKMCKSLRDAPRCAKMGFTDIPEDSFDDDGITVKGSKSNQGFQFGYVNSLEDKSYTIVMKLQGYDSKKTRIQKLVTVRTKLQCETCGKKSRSNNQFCPKCGTSLI